LSPGREVAGRALSLEQALAESQALLTEIAESSP